jgi:hypothetical protein
MALRDHDRRTTRGFFGAARRRFGGARRSTRIFGAFLGAALLAYVAYVVVASVATFSAIETNEDASRTTAPQKTKELTAPTTEPK